MGAKFKAAVDGGSRGNPGIAAWAVAVLGEDDTYLEGHAGLIGRATNNVAEYRALLAALELAESRGADDVTIRADSELIVRQVQGRYRVLHPDLVPLHREAAARIARFPSFRIAHVRRGINRHADRLVNLVLDRAAKAAPGETISIHEIPEPPAAVP